LPYNKALEIIDRVVLEDRREAKAKFETYKNAEQIETFIMHLLNLILSIHITIP